MAKKTEVRKIEDEINAMESRHEEELKPLLEKLSAALIQEAKEEFKIDIGTQIEYRGNKCEVTYFEIRNRSCYPIATQFKKDGTIGMRKDRLYSSDRFTIIKK